MKFSWQYVAGFFDGEGTVFMRSSANFIQPILALYQAGDTGKILLDDLRKWVSEYGAKSNRVAMPQRSGYGKTVYALRFSGRDNVGQFIVNALPYLNVKKTQAQDILRFIRMYPQRYGRSGDWRGEVGS